MKDANIKINWDFTSIPVKNETHKKIRQIALATDEKMYEVVERLASAELNRINSKIK